MKIILASKSPRRIELLRAIGICPEIMPAEVDETTNENTPPEQAVKQLAAAKAQHIADKISSDCLIIAADTLVCKNDVLLGKPETNQRAKEMLLSLSGEYHSVFTGFCVICEKKKIVEAVETRVLFRKLCESEIDDYIATGEPLDKAGAYGIQGRGALLVEKIDGDYFNVVGLPLSKLFEAIKTELSLTLDELVKQQQC